MRDYIISKRLVELCGQRQSLNNESNKLLFNEYAYDRLNNIPLEQSEARTLLILGNKNIIYFVLRKEFHIFGDYENLDEFAVGKIGLVNAVDGYNHKSGMQFVTYAYKVIASEIIKYYNKINSLSNKIEQDKISLNDRLLNDNNEEESFSLESVLADDDNFVEKVVDLDMANTIIRNIKYLTPKEALVVIHYLGLLGKKQLTQIQMAKIFHTSQGNVARWFGNGIKKLRVLTIKENSLSDCDLKLKESLLHQGPQNDILITIHTELNK